MSNSERAVLAGGCFWGMQDLISKRPGVLGTRVGYSGGDVPNAIYRNHGTHAEAIEIMFDPNVVSYRELLEMFFQIHDPTSLNQQGNDRGLAYRSAIYYVDEAQKLVALDTIADVDASGLWPGKVVTQVEPVGEWEPPPDADESGWNRAHTAYHRRHGFREPTHGAGGNGPISGRGNVPVHSSGQNWPT